MLPATSFVVALALAATPYFPVDANGVHGVTKFENEWYGGALERMEQLPLFRRDSKLKTKVYRFTLLPTWDRPTSVQLTVDGDQVEIDGRRLDGHGGYEMGKLSERGTKKLTADDAKEFAALFDRLNFPKLPSTVSDGGADGSQWILEAAEGGSYHVIARWTPLSETKARGLANFVAVCSWLYRKSSLSGDATHGPDAEISRDAGR